MKKTGSLDLFRILACILVISIHTSICLSSNVELNTLITGVIARIAVPFFIMVTGYFTLGKDLSFQEVKKILRKFGLLYIVLILLYLPLNIYGHHFQQASVGTILKMIFLDGTFYHLWYFPALILGFLITWILLQVFEMKGVFWMCLALYVIGLGGDSYYGFVSGIREFKAFYDGIFRVFSYTRNGLFYVPIFLCLGVLLNRYPNPKKRVCVFGTVLSFAILISEGMYLNDLGIPRHNAMYASLPLLSYFLFAYLLKIDMPLHPYARKLSSYVFFLHPWVIVLVRMCLKLFHQGNWMETRSFLFFSLVTLGSFLCSAIVIKLQNVFLKRRSV